MIKIDNTIKRDKCPLCESQHIYFVNNIEYRKPLEFSTHDISLELLPELWKCRNCKSWFTQNIVPENMAESLYSEGDSTNKWSQLTIEEAKTVKVINLLSKEIKKNLKILDIGCNGGQLLDLAKMLGAITAGVDLSDRCIAIIKQKGHQHFSSIMEIDDNERFDIITAFDLVEHLYNVPAFFDFCKTKLVDNGKLIILTGNVFSLNAQITQEKWWYLGAPEHIVFPSRLYFKYHTPFQFKEIIYTYASIAYKEPVIKVLKSFFYQIFKDKYTGIPPICPDHVLIVLQKTNTK